MTLPDIWTDEQVARLAARQADASLHPYTCPGDKPHCEGHRNLIPTRTGWVCRCGDYRQAWSHETGLPSPAPAHAPVASTGEPRKPVDLRCGDCQHVWTGACLPMDLALFARLMQAAQCPMCGASGRRIFLAEAACG
jgi:hypothetical protein